MENKTKTMIVLAIVFTVAILTGCETLDKMATFTVDNTPMAETATKAVTEGQTESVALIGLALLQGAAYIYLNSRKNGYKKAIRDMANTVTDNTDETIKVIGKLTKAK